MIEGLTWDSLALGDRSALIALAVATAGVARNLTGTIPASLAQGGGDLNGSQATSRLFGQAGTAGTRIGVPRQDHGNFTGVV